VHSDADERLSAVSKLQWIGDRHDLHHAGVLEALHTTSHARLGESDFVCDGTVGATTVALEVADDLSINRVETIRRGGNQFRSRALCALLGLTKWFGRWHWSLPAQ
jgi:hypothetical protein